MEMGFWQFLEIQRQTKILTWEVEDGHVTGCEEGKVNTITLDWKELSLVHICGQSTSLLE
jgi:hypothetical protein